MIEDFPGRRHAREGAGTAVVHVGDRFAVRLAEEWLGGVEDAVEIECDERGHRYSAAAATAGPALPR